MHSTWLFVLCAIFFSEIDAALPYPDQMRVVFIRTTAMATVRACPDNSDLEDNKEEFVPLTHFSHTAKTLILQVWRGVPVC